MEGFSGISIESAPTQPMEAAIGFKGLSLEFDQRQYFEPKTGFKSIGVEFDVGGSAVKIWHYNQ